MASVNLAVRFLLELCMLAVAAFWGAHVGWGTLSRILLGAAAPLLIAVVWGLLIAPRARVRLRREAWVSVQLALFGLTVAGLVSAGQPVLGTAFGIAVVLNLGLLLLFAGDHLGVG